MERHKLDGLRRSLAISGSFTRGDCERLIEAVNTSLVERAEVVRILAELPAELGGGSQALNEFVRVVGA